jgi:general secretion pathway protein A
MLCAAVAIWSARPWSSKSHTAEAAPAHTTNLTRGSENSATPAATVAAPKRGAAAMPVSTAPSAAAVGTISRIQPLSELLTQNANETNIDSAFAKLFGLWGVKYVPGATDPCTQAQQQGLDCLTQKGSFAQLRLYNRPAILMLNDDGGGPHQVVLTRLDDEHARIELGGVRHEIGIGELSRYWFGDFVMLWRPGTSQVKSLSPGMHGADVRWLRESLQHVRGQHSDGPVSDVFDTELASLVRDFQRQHRLTVDGIAGVQTQIALASAVAGSDAPLLYVADNHGG